MPNLLNVLRDRAIYLLGAVAAILFAGACAAEDAYRLSIGDRIALRFVQWDTIELGFIEFEAVNGTYSVGSEGTIMLPLIGSIEVAGRSLAELADSLAPALQSRLGLVERPGASLSMAGYRPVYILGSIAKPGAYDFSPGLNVQQAVALAGGLASILDDESDGKAAAIRASGALQQIAMDIARETVRAARLQTEMEGEDDFTIPDGVTHPDGQAAIDAIIENERALFQSRVEAKSRAIDALEDSRALLETEIAALEEKLSGQTRQVELLSDSVGNMESLFERGLVRSPNLISLQGQLINLENRQLDTETAVFRARQSIAELERERVDIEASRRLEVLRELQRAEGMIEQLQARRSMNRQLLLGAEALLAASGQKMEIDVSYFITRSGPDGPETLEATPHTRLGPADVIEVEAVVDLKSDLVTRGTERF